MDELVVEEACALAFQGRLDEALALLAEWPGEGDAGPTLSSVRLLRARLLIARGEAADVAEARDALGDLRQARGTGDWRPDLALARLDHQEGHSTEAAVLLKKALDRFHDRGERHGDTSPALARMLLGEVDRLEPRCAPAGPARSNVPDDAESGSTPDSRSLLRLIELGRRLADETDPEQVLRIVLHEAIELSGTDRGFVVLVRGETLDFALAENLDWSEVERPAFEVSRSLIRKAIQEVKPIFLKVADAGDEHESARSLGEIGIRSVACVPMVHAGSALGVLYLDGQNPSHSFTTAKETMIELFASQAAASLANARAHRAKSQALEAAEKAIHRQRGNEARRERYFDLTGASEVMQDVYAKLDLIASTDLPVLILGETGTGKELVVRILHAQGPRSALKLMTTNCASMAETLLEDELFGHERGAFTGADRARPGLFELAHGGTLFLDEVGDMSARMQANLLRTLQSGEVKRVGAHETKCVDVRVIAATHRNLEEMIRRGEFRQDLFFRLNVLSLRLPPLRDRRDDVPLLVRDLLVRLVPQGRSVPSISARALRRLGSYSWPGNVREVENVVRRLLVLGVPSIEEEHLPEEILSRRAGPESASSLRSVEDEAIRRAVEAAGGKRGEAARLLGIDRKTLYVKLKRLGLDS